MTKRTARTPAFSRLGQWLKRLRKRWYKQKVHRANRKRLHQADPQEHVDKPLNPWSLD
jgi:hypothetical protein